MDNNREIVLEALLLYEKGEYADKIIKSILDKYSYLERFERSFINRVFNGTIERRLTLDFIINSFSSVKVNKQKPVIRTILRMSVYQLIFMDAIPDSAAINEAVKLAKKKKFNGLTGFINGVLRNISRQKDKINLPEGNLASALSVRYSMPEWLCSHFIKECGENKAIEILENSLAERPVIIRTNLSVTTAAELKERLENEGVTVRTPETLLKADEGSPALIISDFDGLMSLETFDEGLFCVQDLSSQMLLNPAYESEAVRNEIIERLKTAELIVDVCAAPGGKTCQAADLVRYYGNENCRIVSRDLTDAKVDRIDENTERCGFDNVETQVHDALLPDASIKGKADIVIADLPCSGLGVTGRKVDIKYRVREEDLAELARLQKEILMVVSEYVRDGGMLIYSTCTVNMAENDENARWIQDELGFKPLGETLQMLNDSPEHDGFFISRFVNG